MDLRIPYTFYPSALPAWIAWALFLAVALGGIGIGVARGRRRGWPSGLGVGVAATIGLFVASVVASMVITFFVHDL